MRFKLAGMVKESIADGPGIRMAVFFQGCSHHCGGCHNPDTHNANGGQWEETETVLAELAKRPQLRGLTLSGGEPLEQSEAAAALAAGAVSLGKDVVLYSGYTWEGIQGMAMEQQAVRNLLEHVWLLVDGPFVEAEKSLFLKFRGSANQRLIDVAQTLKKGNIVLYEA